MQNTLHIGFYVFFPAGGIGRYTHELMKAMGSLPQAKVELICSPDYHWKESDSYAYWDGLKPVWSPKPLKSKYRFLRGQILNPILGINHASKRNLDVLHFSNINQLTFPLWKLFLKKDSIKTAVTVHDVKRQQAMISRKWEDHQLIAIYNYFDILFVHSQHQKNELKSFADVESEKIYVVPHGPYPHGTEKISPEAARKKWHIPVDKEVGIFFGQIRNEKNLDEFLKAMVLAESDFHLLIAGKPWPGHKNSDYYQELIAELNLTNRITFINRFIEEQDIQSLFSAADWATLPYRGDFTSQSGVLNVAAHYECPILVSNAPVLKETVESANIGIASNGDSAEELAESIDEMSAKILNQSTFDFNEYRERFSWRANARKSLKAYQAI